MTYELMSAVFFIFLSIQFVAPWTLPPGAEAPLPTLIVVGYLDFPRSCYCVANAAHIFKSLCITSRII
jgi:hypothetical protein